MLKFLLSHFCLVPTARRSSTSEFSLTGVSPPGLAGARLGMALSQRPLSPLLACLSLFLHPISGPSKVYCHSCDYRLIPQGLILSVKCIRILIYNSVLPLQYALLNQLYFPFWIKLFLLVEPMLIKLKTVVTEQQQQIQYSVEKKSIHIGCIS